MTQVSSTSGRSGAIQFQVGTHDDLQKTAGKTNYLAGLCFAASALFMGLSFYDGYCFFSEREVSLLLRGFFWALVATVIGTAGEILLKTTRVETPVVPMTLKGDWIPGMPNVGNTCFINAPTQAIMTDDVYPGVYKAICERAKARHVSFKSFLELYPAQSGFWPSFSWPQMLSCKKEIESPFKVVNTRDVLVMLMIRRSNINYDSKDFLQKYPIIYGLIGEFSKITKDAEFPAVSDDDISLRQEFVLMKNDADIVRFFDEERTRIANEILGFDAFLHLIQAYEKAVKQQLPVVSFGTWFSTPIGNIRHLIDGARGGSQEDGEELLHCLSKYVMPDDYPKVFFPLAYERIWEECAEDEQDAEKLQELLVKHQNPRDANDLLTEIPNNKKIVERPSPVGVLQIKSVKEIDGQTLLDEMFQEKLALEKVTHFYLDTNGRVRNYYLVSEKIAPSKKMPERIILELIRYKLVEVEQDVKREKIDCAVKMPAQINICDQPYVLKSVVLHSGSPYNGHYYTIVSKSDKSWYVSDDTVKTAEETNVQEAEKDGCLYFYAKKV